MRLGPPSDEISLAMSGPARTVTVAVTERSCHRQPISAVPSQQHCDAAVSPPVAAHHTHLPRTARRSSPFDAALSVFTCSCSATCHHNQKVCLCHKQPISSRPSFDRNAAPSQPRGTVSTRLQHESSHRSVLARPIEGMATLLTRHAANRVPLQETK